MKKKSFSDLDKDKLHEILRLCTEKGYSEVMEESEQQRSELIEDKLSEPLSKNDLGKSLISKYLDSLCDISGLMESVSLRALLFNPDTNISILHKIRKQGKNLLRQSKSPVQKDVATVLYYAAIASALFFHNEKISKLSRDKLIHTLSVLSQANWLPSDLSILFQNAQLRCQKLER